QGHSRATSGAFTIKGCDVKAIAGGALYCECATQEQAMKVCMALNELHAMKLASSETGMTSDVERLKAALRQVKAFLVGEKMPNWENDTTTYLTRGKIADICDFAIAHPQHPKDVHLAVEKR